MRQTPKAVIYCRVSTEDQAENGTSLEAQELAGLRKAAEMGAQVVGQYRDEGVSGGLYLTREGLQAALADTETGKANLLIVYSISRLSRDVEHQQIIRKRIERAGARLVVCDMPMEDTEEGELMFGMFGNFAQYERRLIRKRTMQGSRRLAEKGIQPCRSQQPYGYVIVTHKDVLQGKYPAEKIGTYDVNEEEAAIVRELFTRYAAGRSLTGLCNWLNTSGVPTARNGTCWRPRAIMYMLQNPAYRGQATYGRTHVIEDERRSVENGFKQTRYQRPRTDGKTLAIPTPPIVDEATWYACQQRMAGNRSLMSGNPRRKRLLSGLARCPICGRGLSARVHAEHAYYVCNRSGADLHKPNPCYRLPDLEWLVSDTVVAAEAKPERIEDAFVAFDLLQSQEAENPDDNIADLRHALCELQTREDCAARAQVDALTKGRSTEVYDRMLEEIEAQRKELQNRLRAAQTSQQAPKSVKDPKAATLTVEKALNALRKVLTAEDVLSVAERREVLESFVKEIVPTPEGVRLILYAVGSDPETMQMGVVMYRVLDTAVVTDSEEVAPARHNAAWPIQPRSVRYA